MSERHILDLDLEEFTVLLAEIQNLLRRFRMYVKLYDASVSDGDDRIAYSCKIIAYELYVKGRNIGFIIFVVILVILSLILVIQTSVVGQTTTRKTHKLRL